MFLFLSLILLALFLIGIGIHQIATPLDNLWAHQERYLLARGFAPQRNEIWESKVRNIGWIILVAGIAMSIVTGLLWFSETHKMSGVSINGRQLTQAEWDSCGRNAQMCVSLGLNKE